MFICNIISNYTDPIYYNYAPLTKQRPGPNFLATSTLSQVIAMKFVPTLLLIVLWCSKVDALKSVRKGGNEWLDYVNAFESAGDIGSKCITTCKGSNCETNCEPLAPPSSPTPVSSPKPSLEETAHN